MAKPKNTGLGRGLDAIFLDNSIDESGGVIMLRLSDIEPNPDQPRREFEPEALAQLADSIATHGLIQPIVVRSANAEGYYQIVAGERRWRASKMAGLTEIPAIVLDGDDLKTAQIALIENVQRENLNPVEEAFGYRALIERFDMTQEEVAKQVGKSRPAIANMLRLLDLPDQALELLKDGDISAGHARALLGLKNESLIPLLARRIVTKDLSVRETEAIVKRENAEKAPMPDDIEGSTQNRVWMKDLERRAREALGQKVKITQNDQKRSIEIFYDDENTLEELLIALCGKELFDEEA